MAVANTDIRNNNKKVYLKIVEDTFTVSKPVTTRGSQSVVVVLFN